MCWPQVKNDGKGSDQAEPDDGDEQDVNEGKGEGKKDGKKDSKDKRRKSKKHKKSKGDLKEHKDKKDKAWPTILFLAVATHMMHT